MTPDQLGEAHAVAYLRVSTETQLDGFGLDIQRGTVDEVCALFNLTLDAVYVDEGECGAESLDVRQGLASALDHLEHGEATTLIIPRLDRLARDLIVQESVLADVWKVGATVLSGSATERVYCQPDTPDDPARTLIRQVLGAVAAYERSMIRLRMMKGRRRRLDTTGYAGGPAPYGFVCADEQAILARIHSARRAGAPWSRIAVDLNAAGQFKRNGKPWTRGEVQRTYARDVARPAAS